MQPCKRESFGVGVEAHNVDAALARQPPREIAGTAADIEQRTAGSRLQQLAHELELDIADPLAAWRVIPALVVVGRRRDTTGFRYLRQIGPS